jgi:hypothetical protein
MRGTCWVVGGQESVKFFMALQRVCLFAHMISHMYTKKGVHSKNVWSALSCTGVHLWSAHQKWKNLMILGYMVVQSTESGVHSFDALQGFLSRGSYTNAHSTLFGVHGASLQKFGVFSWTPGLIMIS